MEDTATAASMTNLFSRQISQDGMRLPSMVIYLVGAM
jgi:hypothetical protein